MFLVGFDADLCFFQDEDLKDASRLGDSKDEKVNGMIKKQPQKKGILKKLFWGYLLRIHHSVLTLTSRWLF